MPTTTKTGAVKVILNIEEPKCRFPYFFPAGRALRSTIRADRLKHQPGSPIVMSVGEIPGEQIEFDGEAGMAYIRDRLGEKGNAELRKEIARQVNVSQTILDPAAKGQPREEEQYLLHTDDDRATWLAHMVRLVDSGAAVVVKGSLPSREEVNRLGTWTKGEYFGFQTPSVTKHFKTADV
jgi:hypothetical protein